MGKCCTWRLLINYRFYLVTLSVVIIGFALSILGIYETSKFSPVKASTSCPTFPMTTLSQNTLIYLQTQSWWHWSYDVTSAGASGYFQLYCPSNNHDVVVHLNGMTGGKTSGRIGTTSRARTSILDCHGNVQYISTTGPPWHANVNSNSLLVAYLIQSPSGAVVAYVDGNKPVFPNFTIQDAITNTNIAMLSWAQPDTGGWTWRLQLLNGNFSSHPMANPIVLSLLAGQRTYFASGSRTDVCNHYFSITGWVLLALAICVFLYVTFYFVRCYWRWTRLTPEEMAERDRERQAEKEEAEKERKEKEQQEKHTSSSGSSSKDAEELHRQRHHGHDSEAKPQHNTGQPKAREPVVTHAPQPQQPRPQAPPTRTAEDIKREEDALHALFTQV